MPSLFFLKIVQLKSTSFVSVARTTERTCPTGTRCTENAKSEALFHKTSLPTLIGRTGGIFGRRRKAQRRIMITFLMQRKRHRNSVQFRIYVYKCGPFFPIRSLTIFAGGNGYINDYATGRLLRDAKLYEIGAGTSEIRRLVIGRAINAEYMR